MYGCYDTDLARPVWPRQTLYERYNGKNYEPLILVKLTYRLWPAWSLTVIGILFEWVTNPFFFSRKKFYVYIHTVIDSTETKPSTAYLFPLSGFK